jgi:hypothetical protein
LFGLTLNVDYDERWYYHANTQTSQQANKQINKPARKQTNKQNNETLWPLVRKRTIPTELPPLVGQL